MSQQTSHPRRIVAGIAGGALAAGALVVLPAAGAVAAVDGSDVVISEVYGGGGNSGAPLANDFIELHNPTGSAIELSGMTLEYRSAAGGSGGTLALDGTVEAGGYFLVQLAAGGNADAGALPTPDATADINMSGTNGRVFLYAADSGFDSSLAGDRAGASGLVDMVGFGSAASFEGAAAPTLSNATSAQRVDPAADSDDNSADFAAAAPTPVNSAGESEGGETDPGEPEEPTEPGDVISIADANQLTSGTVTVRGVVTAVYAEGGFNGFTIQDPAGDPADGVSDAIFVYSPASYPAIGDSVEVTGGRVDYNGLAEVNGDLVTKLDESLGDVAPFADWSAVTTDAGKKAHQSELMQFSDDADFVVSDNYDTNYYGSFVIADGGQVVRQTTAYVDPHDTEAVDSFAAAEQARTISVDDGRSTNFNTNKDLALTYLTPENPLRVGSPVSFAAPMVLDYRYSTWALQPTQPIAYGDTGSAYVSVENTRLSTETPADLAGDISIANFNVLNFFPTTGEEYAASTGISCSYYTDRTGAPVTTNRCGEVGPRGAADDENLERQQAKTVKSIVTLDASILALQEIENSSEFGQDRDAALAYLVDLLNAAEGSQGDWAYAASPADLPDDEDVIRSAFIYQTDEVETVGESHILNDEEHWSNAREPLAQGFKEVGTSDDDAFLVFANHFKSKSSGTDDGTGQGNSNPDRVGQANSLLDFVSDIQDETGIEPVFLSGDFNSYAMEDPAVAIEEGGFTNLNYALNGGEPTYVYDGMSGSLDHVFANAEALALVQDVDVWQINGQEQVGFEYSRYNYNATLLYDDSVFRTSDHNPIRVGIAVGGDGPVDPTEPEAPAWQQGSVYDKGDQVTYQGAVYTAQWWTTETPGSSVYGSWMEQGASIACAEGDETAWTSSQVYTGGERVVSGGQVYEAKWWTRNQKPGDAWGPWQVVGSC
ncbi:ExeM/NucH family extracellular endonuclease [Microbacterium indicum]|uniref:ExeM/NucH family extracellular endonuclease n=1 Tax=Microbacterium indicum TaxID=358100 RepID=UPI000490682D|nr:ExeM/NucH family extracellular endonuclease [Microbacterium indicum]